MVNIGGASTSDITIANNNITNFGSSAAGALVKVAIASPYALSNCKVYGNKIGSTPGDGVYLDRVTSSEVNASTGSGITGSFQRESGCTQNQWMNNQGISIGTIGISGLASTSEGSGNRYTAERLNKTVTIPSAGSSYTLTHGGGVLQTP